MSPLVPLHKDQSKKLRLVLERLRRLSLDSWITVTIATPPPSLHSIKHSGLDLFFHHGIRSPGQRVKIGLGPSASAARWASEGKLSFWSPQDKTATWLCFLSKACEIPPGFFSSVFMRWAQIESDQADGKYLRLPNWMQTSSTFPLPWRDADSQTYIGWSLSLFQSWPRPQSPAGGGGGVTNVCVNNLLFCGGSPGTSSRPRRKETSNFTEKKKNEIFLQLHKVNKMYVGVVF